MILGINTSRLIITLCCVLTIGLNFCLSQNADSNNHPKVVAFPGAEGFGKYTSGGRGGKVLIVTNLNDDGPGSLREAVRKKGPRIIVFNVSGNIVLLSPLDINNNDITIAGQSAPGDGICIRNQKVRINADNVIVRYMRFRLGDESKVQDDAFGGTKNKDVIIDHCSISWATDECASFYYNKNFTMQWCIISESLNSSVHEKGDHGYGGIWGGEKASFHHNLLANHVSRLPRFSGSESVPNTENELVDFRNNVIYNWKDNNTYGGEKGKYNIVSNYYKPGPSTNKDRLSKIINPYKPYGRFYIDNNTLVGSEQVTNDNKLGIAADSIEQIVVPEAYPVEHIITEDSKNLLVLVLSQAGASYKRDVVDERIVYEVKTGTATFGKNKDGIIDSQNDVGGWPELESAKLIVDKDNDGMDDKWEKRKGLNNKNSGDAASFTLSSEYTNIEVYLDELLQKKR